MKNKMQEIAQNYDSRKLLSRMNYNACHNISSDIHTLGVKLTFNFAKTYNQRDTAFWWQWLQRHFESTLLMHFKIYLTMWIRGVYTECSRRNVPDFGRMFLILKYTDITQNTYIQSWTVTEIMAREVWKYDSCYTLTDYQIHIKTGRNMWFLYLTSN